MGTISSLSLINGIFLPYHPPFANSSELSIGLNHLNQPVVEAAQAQQDSQVVFWQTKGNRLETGGQLAESWQNSQKSYRRDPSYQNLIAYTLTGLLFFTQQKDIRAILILCQKAETHFSDGTTEDISPRLIIYYHYLLCLVHLLQVEDGKKVAEKAFALMEPTSTSWFKFQELLVLLYSRTAQYEEAYILLKKAMGDARFDRLPPKGKERWMIYEAYLLFALSTSSDRETAGSFLTLLSCRSQRLCYQTVEEMTPTSYKILLVVLQAIVYKDAEVIKEYSLILEKDCADAKLKNQRWGYFLEWILEVSTAGFCSDIINVSADKCIYALRQSNKSVRRSFHYLEVITFENLWVMCLNLLS